MQNTLEQIRDFEGEALAPLDFDISTFSPYLARLIRREEAFLEQAYQTSAYRLCAQEIAAMEADVAGLEDEALIKARLRQAKSRIALITALADIGGIWPLEAVTAILSDLAEAACRVALSAAWRNLARRGELAEKEAGFFILALGKLGGRELNYSSDIDLILLFDSNHFPSSGKRTPSDCAVRLTRKIADYLQDRTADGYVFRVDLRLRPDPGSTPVAMSIAAAESYYQSIGQTWERSAFIKARPIAGDQQAADKFLEHLRPFIWRRHLDFAAIDDIHTMKARIHEHHQHSGIGFAGHDIKLGLGGIREIEFFAQIHQLISGGRRNDLQIRPTLGVLKALMDAGDISQSVYDDLRAAYYFFRQVEHRLQMVNDQQTQTLPENRDELTKFAQFMGYSDLAAFKSDTLEHLTRVHAHYEELLPDDEKKPAVEAPLLAGFTDEQAAQTIIETWRSGRYRALKTARARGLLEKVFHNLLTAFSTTADPDLALKRFDQFLAQLPAGVQLFSLFNANPKLLNMVAKIMGTAPALAEQLTRRPVLLDSVLSHDFFAPLPDTKTLLEELNEQLALAHSFEEVLDRARIWVNERRFQLGVLSLEGLSTPIATGDCLTRLADATLQALFPHILSEFEHSAGEIPGGSFAILGLGGYGAKALTYTSDLDLVFLYDCPADSHSSGGRSELSANQYYSRLSQRVISALTVLTGEGRLFEIDMRLRPSGRAGIIAVSLDAFTRYQAEEAWSWEHMTLTKARIIVAPSPFRDQIEAAIRHILSQKRDRQTLIKDVQDMRRRYDQEFKPDGRWHLNSAHGGLADLNWVVQTKLLENGLTSAFEASTMEDQLRLLATHDVLEKAETDRLTNAWRLLFSARAIRRLLLGPKGEVEKAPDAVKRTLAKLLGDASFKASCERLDGTLAEVAAIFARHIGYPEKE